LEDITRTYDEAISAARTVLPARTVTLNEVIVDYPGAAAIILRCRVEPTDDGRATVIVKWSRSETQHLFREWANLAFLNNIPALRGIVPALYGGDEDAEVLVMADAGNADYQLLGNIVEGDDPVRAEAGLLAFQRTLGWLHAATIGKQSVFDGYRVRRGKETTSRHVIHDLVDRLESLPAMLAGEGVLMTPALERDVASAIAALRDPGPFLAFTHGDAAIGNVFYLPDGTARLIDFETSDFRHALLDGCYARMRYLVSVWARRMPHDIQQRLLAAYRAELATGCPAATDDARFNHALASCSAAWLATIVSWLPSVVEADRKRGRSTVRQRIVTALDHFAVLSAETGYYGALAEASDTLAGRLRREWGAEATVMRLCNAFAT
jgi:hypothetical protein